MNGDAGIYYHPTPEEMLRELHKRFDRVELTRRFRTTYFLSCQRSIKHDSRIYAPTSWGPTAQSAIALMWSRG